MYHQTTSAPVLPRPVMAAVSLLLLALSGALPLAAQPLIWTGSASNNWDATTQNNWTREGAATAYADGADVVFDDTSVTGTIAFPANVAPGSIVVDTSRDLVFATTAAAAITGTAPLTKRGGGTLSFSGKNGTAYTGTTTIEAGILLQRLNNTDIAPSLGPIVFAGGTLTHTRYTSGETSLTDQAFHVPDGQTGAFVANTSRKLKFQTILTGGGTLAVDVTNATGASSYYFELLDTDLSGFTGELRFVSTGAIRTVNNRPLNRASSFDNIILVLENATLAQYNTNAANFKELRIGALSSSGTFARLQALNQSLGTHYIIGGKNLDTTYAGDFADGSASNPASLTKVGAGVLTLSGTTAHTGSTIVQAGALNLAGAFTAASPVTVAATGSLGGSGSVTGNVTVADGATLFAAVSESGGAAGLEVAGAATLGATLNISLHAPAGAALASGTHTITVLHAAGGIAGAPVLAWTGPAVDGNVALAQTTDSITATITPHAPVITSALTATGTAGIPFSYQIVATNNPASYTATGLPSGLSVATTTGVISGLPSVVATSTVAITATNAGGSDTRNLVLTIESADVPTVAPSITSAPTATGTVGAPFSYQIAAAPGPISGYAAAPLPAGLALNAVTGLVSGTPSAWGATTITLSATNAVGTGTAGLVLTAYAPPVITSAATAEGIVGGAFSYTITAEGGPGNTFAATGLPSGLSLAAATGVISGTPTGIGAFTGTLTATNPAGSDTKTLDLTVTSLAPAITSPLRATGTVGLPFAYQIAATNTPASFAAEPLPDGFAFAPATGVISAPPPRSPSSPSSRPPLAPSSGTVPSPPTGTPPPQTGPATAPPRSTPTATPWCLTTPPSLAPSPSPRPSPPVPSPLISRATLPLPPPPPRAASPARRPSSSAAPASSPSPATTAPSAPSPAPPRWRPASWRRISPTPPPPPRPSVPSSSPAAPSPTPATPAARPISAHPAGRSTSPRMPRVSSSVTTTPASSSSPPSSPAPAPSKSSLMATESSSSTPSSLVSPATSFSPPTPPPPSARSSTAPPPSPPSSKTPPSSSTTHASRNTPVSPSPPSPLVPSPAPAPTRN
ncbi:putative Ig domain-containing protein [Termitidicoccus mucosus]